MSKPNTRRKPTLRSERLLTLVADKTAKAKKLFVMDPYNVTMGNGPSWQARHDSFVRNGERILNIAPKIRDAGYTIPFICAAAKLLCVIDNGTNTAPNGSSISEFMGGKLLGIGLASLATGVCAHIISRRTENSMTRIEPFEDSRLVTLQRVAMTKDDRDQFDKDAKIQAEHAKIAALTLY